MNKNLQKIEFKNFSKYYDGILTNDMNLADKILKENSDANILIVTPKRKRPNESEPPSWFKNWFKDFWNKLDNRLKRIEDRIDNLVKKNNLKE